MDDRLLTHDGPLVEGTVVDRPNRFVLRVRFDGGPERVYLGDPGALRGTVDPGSAVLCTPVDDPDRATGYDAVAARVDGVLVSLKAALANDLFAAALARGLLPAFRGYGAVTREPPLPDHGRTDFLLERDGGRRAYVEVKSCTHTEDGVALFPDRPTARGRRHLRSLEGLLDDRTDGHVVFVVQRPDAGVLRPFRAVDPAFAEELRRVRDAGVGVRAVATAFDAPHYRLVEPSLPVEVG